MIIKAHVLKDNHVLDVTFSLTKAGCTVTKVPDGDCYLALKNLIDTGTEFIMGGDKHDNENVRHPVYTYSFDFGSSVIFAMEESKHFLGIQFNKDGAIIKDHKGNTIVTDNDGIVDYGDGIKAHFSASQAIINHDIIQYCMDIITADVTNGSMQIPKHMQDAFNAILQVAHTIRGLYEMMLDPENTIMVETAIAAMCAPIIIFDSSSANGPEYERLGEAIDTICESVYEAIDESTDVYIDMERYTTDFPKALIMFDANNLSNSVNMYESRKYIEQTIINTDKGLYTLKSEKELEEYMESRQFYDPMSGASVITAMLGDDGKLHISNKEQIKEFVSMMKCAMGIDEDGELPPLPVKNGTMFRALEDKTCHDISNDGKEFVINELRELGLNIFFID